MTAAMRRFARDETGAGLVEFSLVVLLFLFLLFAIIDFGRLANAWVAANKATQIAARLAAVRPPVCAGVPTMNVRGTAASPPNFGSLCRSVSGACANPGVISCQGVATSATALEIFNGVRALVPPGTQISDMRYSYAFDPNLGFLGGPYVPMVTVEFLDGNSDRLRFTFVSQLRFFVTALTGNASTLGAELEIPGMSVSLPGEDLALGNEG